MESINDTDAMMQSWNECLGSASWILEALERNAEYSCPLPVQKAVIPTISRAILSGTPLDVSLTAPTGSGKTLCYIIPMLRFIAEEKKRNINDTKLRAIILVPTKVLGQQVFREILRLTVHTTISVATLCGQCEGRKSSRSTLMRNVCKIVDTLNARNTQPHGASIKKYTQNKAIDSCSYIQNSLSTTSFPRTCYDHFFAVDVLVSTPEQLLSHLDQADGFSLRTLSLLVVDEADQVLEGSFADVVIKLLERFEEEVLLEAVREEEDNKRLGCFKKEKINEDNPLLKYLLFSRQYVTGKGDVSGRLHKIICSATLSPRIARISQMHLRNCQYFTLGAHGENLAGNNTVAPVSSVHTVLNMATSSASPNSPLRSTSICTSFALPPNLQEHVIFVEEHYRHAVLLKLVRTLLDRMNIKACHSTDGVDIFSTYTPIESEKDHACVSLEDDDDDATRTSLEAYSKKKCTTGSSRIVREDSYPSVDDQCGNGILVFCSSAEEARVMGHFLSSAGISGILEFTTLASEAERRHALLHPCSCVVASDSLMRGIEIPNIGHVIMYHPPETLSQYVHRVGRTARAMRPGHVHLLLNKLGPSATQEDGEVSKFKKLSRMCIRTLPTRFERGFFVFKLQSSTTYVRKKALPNKFASHETLPEQGILAEETSSSDLDIPMQSIKVRPELDQNHCTSRKSMPIIKHKMVSSQAPPNRITFSSDLKNEVSNVVCESNKVSRQTGDTAEWWVEEANRSLCLSQQRLSERWSSALDLAAKAQHTASPSQGDIPSASFIPFQGESKLTSTPTFTHSIKNSKPSSHSSAVPSKHSHKLGDLFLHSENMRKDGAKLEMVPSSRFPKRQRKK